MQYINTTTMEFPVSEAQLRDRFSNVSFPDPFVAPAPYAEVITATYPSNVGVRQAVLDSVPTLIGSVWTLGWTVSDFDNTTKEVVLASLRARIITHIKSIRDEKTQTNGFYADGKWFHSDTFSRTQQMALVMMGSGIPVGLQWKTMDGTYVPMTQQLANNIFGAAGISDVTIFAYATSLIDQVNASDDPGTIDIYNGWPIGFGA